jgi:hypothetical protein
VITASEPDKLLTLLRIEDSHAGFTQASGVDLVEFIDSYSDGIQFMGRRLHIEDSTFDNREGHNWWWESIALGGFTPVEYVEIKDSTFNGPNRQNMPTMKGAYVIEKIIGSKEFSLSGTDLIISNSDPDFWEGDGLSNRLYEGQHLLLQDADGETRGYGEVTSIRSNGGPYTARIGMEWSVAPMVGDRIYQFVTMKVVGINNTLNDMSIEGWNEGMAYIEWNGEVVRDSLWVP